MIKIGYFADGPWAHKAFELFLERENVEISFLVPRFDARDQYLIEKCKSNDIPVLFLEDVNTNESIAELKRYDANLYVSMSFNQILKKPILDAGIDFINCHAGLLPNYRGRNVLNWALINNEKEFGVTVHYVDEGIDTGDIILQKRISIAEEDQYSDLLSKAVSGCAEILDESIQMIAVGTVKRTRQSDLGEGFYCSKRGPGDEIIDWSKTTLELYNFIRGIAPPSIGATCFYSGQSLTLTKAKKIPFNHAHEGLPGVVVGKTEEGNLVKTKDGLLLIEEIHFKGVSEKPSFPIGTKLKGKWELIQDKLLSEYI